MVDFCSDLSNVLEDNSMERDVWSGVENLFSRHLSRSRNHDADCTAIANAIPTFQAPRQSFPTTLSFQNDEAILFNLLSVAAEQNCQLKLVSAYLNPTPALLELLSNTSRTTFVTASSACHGFASTPKTQQPTWAAFVLSHAFEAISQTTSFHPNQELL